MSLWNEVPTSLTSFAPLTSEVQSSSNFLSRFFKRGKDDSDQSSTEGSRASSREVSVERGASREQSLDRPLHREASLTPPSGAYTGEVKGQGAVQKDMLTPDSFTGSVKSMPNEASNRKMSVVARLTDILNKRTATPQVYRDSDFKQYWMPDSSCKECYHCNDKFTTFRRRHHCRICGQIFCNNCCNKELSGKIIGYKGSIRVCDYCHQIVNSYAQKANPTGDPRVTTEVLHEIQSESSLSPDQGLKVQKLSNYDLHRSLSLRSPSDLDLKNDGIAPFDRTPQSEFVMSLNFPRERRLLVQDSQELKSLYAMMMDPEYGLEFDNYRVRLRNSHRVIAGNKLVDWLKKNDKVATRVQGVAVGQALIDAEYLDPIHNMTTPFRDDYTLYRPTQAVVVETITPENDPLDSSLHEDSAPLWFQQIKPNTHPDDDSTHGYSSTETLDRQLSSAASHLSEDSTGAIKVDERHFDDPAPPQSSMGTEELTESMFEGDVPTSEQPMAGGWRNLSMNSDDAEQKEAFNKLQEEHHDHLTQLTRQLLSEEQLPLAWADIIISTVDRVALSVQPDIKQCSDEMDIRKYVHIKKIPGSTREDTNLMHGVIFKKNVANRKMPQSINKPNVLLLYGSIEYQRVENKMSALEPLISQEREFLKKNIAKIVDLKQKPDILIVEKSVANIAQKFLLDEGITLINNVKLSVMQRLSRFLDTDIVASIDSLVRGVRLGFCHTFSVQNFKLPGGERKTMVSFDGCATHLGCAVTLRGGPNKELTRVKKIIKFMLFASYHSRLEIAFCLDECMTPSEKADFDLDKEDIQTSKKESKGANELDGKQVMKDGKDRSRKQEMKGEGNTSSSDRRCKVGDSNEGDSETDFTSVEDTDSKASDSQVQYSQSSSAHGSGEFTVSEQSGDVFDKIDDEEEEAEQKEEEVGKDGNNAESMKVSGAANDLKKEVQRNDALPKSVLADSVKPEVNASTEFKVNASAKGEANASAMSVSRAVESVESEGKQDCEGKSEGKQDCEGKSVFDQLSSECLKDSDSLKLMKEPIAAVDEEKVPSFIPLDKNAADKSDRSLKKSTKQSSAVADIGKDVGITEGEMYNSDASSVKFYISDQTAVETVDVDEDIGPSSITGESVVMSDNCPSKNITVAGNLNGSQTDSARLVSKSMPVIRRREKSGPRSDKSPNLHRKSEMLHLTDKSDPLQNYQISLDDTIFQSSLALQEQMLTHRHKFRKALENVILCISPFIQYDLPYLETEIGAKCELRRFFPEEIYWSHTFSPKPSGKQRHSDKDKKSDCSSVKIKDAHEFIQSQLALPAYDVSTQHLIASFRAYGGRLNVIDKDLSSKINSAASKDKDRERRGCNPKEPVTAVGGEWKVDCLDPFRHQRIAVLFSSFSYVSENHPSPCVYPWVVNMEFYGRNDITLGGFLERFCFRPSYVCPSDSCNTSMDKHIRRFIHRNGSISIMLKRHNKPIQQDQERILIWSWCYRCKQVTKIVPMSMSTWNMSFAKYLELRFHGNTFRRMDHTKCPHSLHHDHYQYFGFQETVASFRFSPIKLKEIKLPPLVIRHVPDMEVMLLYRMKEEVKALTAKMLKMFSLCLEYMANMKSANTYDLFGQTISEYIQQQQAEKKYLLDIAQDTREKLEILLKSADTAKLVKLTQGEKQMLDSVEDSLVLMKKCMSDTVTNWNLKFQDLYVTQKKANRASQNQKKEKDAISVSSTVAIETDEKGAKSSVVGSVTEPDGTELVPVVDGSPATGSPGNLLEEELTMSDIYASDFRRKSDFSFVDMSPPPLPEVKSVTSVDSYLYGVTPDEAMATSPRVIEGSGAFDVNTDQPEELDVEKVDESTEVLHPKTEEVEEEVEEEEEVVKAEAKDTEVVRTGRDRVPVAEPSVKKYSGEEQTDGQTDNVGGLRKKFMSSIWQGSSVNQLPMPFDACEHHLLPKCHRLPVVVYDHEPSSIISYGLSSVDYNNKLQELQTVIAQSQRGSKTDSEMFEKSMKEEGGGLNKKPSMSKLSFFRGSMKELPPRPDTPPDSVRYVARSDSSSLESPEEADYSVFTASINEAADKSKLGKQAPSMHIEIQFSDPTARFYCKVYFAEQFRQLRKLIYPEGEDSFIRSLSRCKPWEAKGGKSGSTFCKTDDDRFILKQMSGMEVESFEKFGPHYFHYISEAKQQQRPTALAKIVGVYRIGFRNQQTNSAMKQDLLILENLFYNRNISQTFDLKGSERNRLVKNTRSKRDEELVLLDENFLKDSVDNPLYIMPHSKRVLMQAINLDSEFLSTNLVMDYSLLVGLDETQKELIIGVIDYIRTFTWDKKLETILKSNFGGQGKMPTVVSPELYRTRFLDAMARYFLAVPDQWSGLGRDIEL